jgi:hypothetical protein
MVEARKRNLRCFMLLWLCICAYTGGGYPGEERRDLRTPIGPNRKFFEMSRVVRWE